MATQNILTGAGEQCVVVRGWDKNAVADTEVTIPNGAQQYFYTRVIETNTSATQAGSSSTLSLYTGAAASGTAVVSAATATSLTAASVYKAHTVASHALQTGSTAYLRNTVAEGGALTVDVYIFFMVLN